MAMAPTRVVEVHELPGKGGGGSILDAFDGLDREERDALVARIQAS